MSKHNRYRITVKRDRGTFPLDMLRYDSCWPATQEDTGKVAIAYHCTPIEIEVIGLHKPTIERWSSYGWDVTNVEGYRV